MEGTEYVVMECIVLEGGDDVQLEPGEVVTLVRVEGGGASLRVRTTDAHLTEGTLPATFLRKKTTTNGVDMEGTYIAIDSVHMASYYRVHVVFTLLVPKQPLSLPHSTYYVAVWI